MVVFRQVWMNRLPNQRAHRGSRLLGELAELGPLFFPEVDVGGFHVCNDTHIGVGCPMKKEAPAGTGAGGLTSLSRKHSTGSTKTSGLRRALVDPPLRDALRALDPAGYVLSLLPEGLYRQIERYLNGPPKKGRTKGKQQAETLERIVCAAALVFLKYSQPKMIPLLYPEQHVPEAGRKAVNKFLSRNKGAIDGAKKRMKREQTQQNQNAIPRDKNQ